MNLSDHLNALNTDIGNIASDLRSLVTTAQVNQTTLQSIDTALQALLSIANDSYDSSVSSLSDDEFQPNPKHPSPLRETDWNYDNIINDTVWSD